MLLIGMMIRWRQHQKKEATIHGTHVAGIIGANGKMKGIAPDAEIYSYRALGPGGTGTSVQVIAAIEKAVEDKMDIINLSLGSSVNLKLDWPTSLAVNKAVEMGVSVVTANGNEVLPTGQSVPLLLPRKQLSVGAVTTPQKTAVLYERFYKKLIPILPLQGAVEWKAASIIANYGWWYRRKTASGCNRQDCHF